MTVVTGDRYLECLVKFVEKQAGPLIDRTLVLKLNPVGLHYVQSRLEALKELEGLLAGAPVDYLRAYVSDLGDHRALEQLRKILRLLTSLKVVSVLTPPARDPTPVSLLPFGRLKILELRGCDLSTSPARGLLESRHTLEKIICHNSTDALRHIFASRIAEIKDSQNWNRLSFVSCACNGLVLMDESLQLLPVVETLDLSRNKIAKVDNLRKCTRLKHLDLGFNHLSTIASLSEVSSQIVKLVLRNNAITTLHGIENLKSLEGLDLSYNLISKFSELEILAGFPSLQSLWLEGNPLCCARWYRAQVFSLFRLPDKLKLDEKRICRREFWKRQIIIASRQKRPASFGLYSLAKGDAEFEGTINTKKKKHCRLASIEREERTLYLGSDQDSVSCDNETVSKEENGISDEETEIVGLMNRIEYMKKERSGSWLLEFKDWLNQESQTTSNSYYEHNPKVKTSQRHRGESSRYVSNSFQASVDGCSTDILEHSNWISGRAVGRMDLKLEQMKRLMHINQAYLSIGAGYYNRDPLEIPGAEKITLNKASGDIVESFSPSICPGSPPHYRQDILHRRHYLEEEFWQLSADSYSISLSDSNTSLSEDDFTKSRSIPDGVESLIEEFSERSGHSCIHHFEETNYIKGHEVSQLTHNGTPLSASEHSSQLLRNDIPTSERDDEILHRGKQKADWLERKNCRRKPKKRLIVLAEEKNHGVEGNGEPSQKLNEDLDNSIDRVEDERRQVHGSVLHSIAMKKSNIAIAASHSRNGVRITSGSHSLCLGAENFIGNYFNSTVADLRVNETSREYIQCNCIIEKKSGFGEREVVVLLSSEHKLYVLLIDAANAGSGISLELMGCHKIEDVKEVLVGLGLQMLRIRVGRSTTYLFPTRSINISRQLLCILHSSDLDMRKQNWAMKSLEQAQVESFEKHFCGGLKISMFQYSMVLFSHKNLRDLWFPRSLFVLKGHLVVCIEDFMQFEFLSDDKSSPYYSLDSCCCITDISQMVINTREICCLTLYLERKTSTFCASQEAKVGEEDALTLKNSPSTSLTWKLKWFSEDSLFNFVSLLKAIHAGMTDQSSSPLLVTRVS